MLIIGPKTSACNNLEHCVTLDGCSVNSSSSVRNLGVCLCVCVCERTCLATRTGAISSTRTFSTHTCMTHTLTCVIPTGQRTTTHLQKHTHIRQLLHTLTHTCTNTHTHQTAVTHTHTHLHKYTHTPGHSATLDWHTVAPLAAGHMHMSAD